jgi:hypothetical protein
MRPDSLVRRPQARLTEYPGMGRSFTQNGIGNAENVFMLFSPKIENLIFLAADIDSMEALMDTPLTPHRRRQLAVHLKFLQGRFNAAYRGLSGATEKKEKLSHAGSEYPFA